MDEGERTVDAAAVSEQAAVEKGSDEPASAASESGGTGSTDDLAKVRELVLKAHPDVVPDLVQGGSVDELIASVEPARSAYQRVADAVRAGNGTEDGGRGTEAKTEPAAPPAVPAGGASNVIDPSTLAPTTKIARGLAERRRG